MLFRFAFVGCLCVAPGCKSTSSAPSSGSTQPSTAVAEPSAPAQERAAVSRPAPDFTLRDLDGRPFRLSEQRGKVVVLEWFNPECPFVRASHTKGSLVSSAERQQTKGVVWVAINSGAPGKQGHGVEKNRSGREQFKMKHPVLLDESGQVGRQYGAEHTPHMYVIDAKGTLVYKGAIDNSPDGEGESPSGGKLINYVDVALADLAAGRPIATAETEAYGCSVKYSN